MPARRRRWRDDLPGRGGLRTGEVAEQAGVNIQTLRYYERRGLLTEPVHSNGGHRLYPPDTVALLNVIKAAQRLGFTLVEVAELLDTGRRRHPAPDLRQRSGRRNSRTAKAHHAAEHSDDGAGRRRRLGRRTPTVGVGVVSVAASM